MAWTKFENADEKKRLQERALALRPKVPGVVATELGWALPTVKGTMEILVRYDGLDALLGDAVSEVEVVGEPIVIEVELEEIPAEVVGEEVKVEEKIEEVKVELAVEPPAPKRPGRPKKVAE